MGLYFFFILFYGIIIEKWWMQVPNGMGLGLGLAQLLLYIIYRNAKKPLLPLNTSIITSQQQPLISSDPQP